MKSLLVLLLAVWLNLPAFGAGEIPASFSLEGVLYETPSGSAPLLDSAARIRVQIVDPSGNCVLYDEQQTVNTSGSNGLFTVQVGSSVASGKRVGGSDPANAMAAVFQNLNPIPAAGSSCGSSVYIPSPGATRFARMIVTPSLTNVPDVLAPLMEIGAVPTAQVANTLDGIPRAGFLQVQSGANLSQGNLESIFTGTNYSTLTTLLSGGGNSGTAAGSYAINAGTGGSGGIDLKTNGSTKASLAYNGDFSVDGGTFFVQAGTDRVGLGTTTPGASLDLSQKTDALALPVGATGDRPSPALAGMIRFNSTLSKIEFHNGTGWNSIGTDIAGIGASGDLSGTFPGPTVSKIRGQSVSATATTSGQVLRFDGVNYTPRYVALSDLKNTAGGNAFSATCSSSQSLTWSSVDDTFVCASIAGLNASVIASGTIDAARLPTSANAWQPATGGINYGGGKVGIGTTAPAGALDAIGASRFGVDAADSVSIDAVGGYGTLRLQNVFGTASLSRNAHWDGFWQYDGPYSGASSLELTTSGLNLRTAPSTAGGAITWSNSLSILATNGNVGIGTTAPGAKLEVDGGSANTSGLKFTRLIATSPPASGRAIGVDASGNVIAMASGGGGSPVISALTDGPTVLVDGSLGDVFTLSLTGDHALANPTNLIDGKIYTFRITQDGTGNRTLSFGTNYKFGSTATFLSNAANAQSIFTFASDGTALYATGAYALRTCVAGSVTYASAGTYSLSLPSGCTSFSASLWGGGGGGGGGGFTSPGLAGGGGGFATASFTGIANGASLSVQVGGGGGAGTVSGGGGGGGRSAILYNAAEVLIAGGGGGGGGGNGYSIVSSAGGAGGGAFGSASNGGAGSPSGPGSGGSGSQPGAPGSGYLGGNGGNNSAGGSGGSNGGGAGSNGQGFTSNAAGGGGGGGGGYFGGGGGSWSQAGGGGGGGSAFVSSVVGTLVSSSLVGGSGTTPGSTSSPYNGTAGAGGAGKSGNIPGTVGTAGQIVLSYP